MNHKSLNQLLCAAMVNGRFCETLLRDPAQALASGYYEHSFSLTPEERDLVMGIRAQRLEDFAAQVYCWISGNSSAHHGNGFNGNGHKIGNHSGNGHKMSSHNGNGHNGYKGNGHNGYAGNGHSDHQQEAGSTTDGFVDLFRVPMPALT